MKDLAQGYSVVYIAPQVGEDIKKLQNEDKEKDRGNKVAEKKSHGHFVKQSHLLTNLTT